MAILTIITVSPRGGTREGCCGPQASAVSPPETCPPKGQGPSPGPRPTPDMWGTENYEAGGASLDWVMFLQWPIYGEE